MSEMLSRPLRFRHPTIDQFFAMLFSDACFYCAELNDKKNMEHVFPKWLLKYLDFFDNRYRRDFSGPDYTMGQQKLTICLKCNEKLKDVFEDKVSHQIKNLCASNHIDVQMNFTRITYWLMLLSLKITIGAFKKRRNVRLDAPFIPQQYVGNFHSQYLTLVLLREFVEGEAKDMYGLPSCRITFLPQSLNEGPFYFRSSTTVPGLLLKLRDWCFIGVFDDLGSTNQLIRDEFASSQRRVLYSLAHAIKGFADLLALREVFKNPPELFMHGEPGVDQELWIAKAQRPRFEEFCLLWRSLYMLYCFQSLLHGFQYAETNQLRPVALEDSGRVSLTHRWGLRPAYVYNLTSTPCLHDFRRRAAMHEQALKTQLLEKYGRTI